MTQPTNQTPEQLAAWREQAHEYYLKDVTVDFDSERGYVYEAGYLRAMTEQSAEIAELRESQTMALDTVSAQLDLLADRWAEIERLKGEMLFMCHCRGITDNHCHYMASCGNVCNKCGNIHNGLNPKDTP